MTAKPRYRVQYKFWLNQYDEEENRVSQIIEWLKLDRDFVGAIRDGLRLIWDLRSGGVGVLLELFPDIRQRLAVPEPPKSDPDEDEIKRQIAELKRLIIETGITKDAPLVAGPKKLPGLQPMMKLPEPNYDDEDTVVIRKNTSDEASQNLFKSMQGLQN